MPGRDILRNATMVAPAVFDPRRVPLFVFYTGRDRRFVKEMQAPSKCPFKGLKIQSVAHL